MLVLGQIPGLALAKTIPKTHQANQPHQDENQSQQTQDWTTSRTIGAVAHSQLLAGQAKPSSISSTPEFQDRAVIATSHDKAQEHKPLAKLQWVRWGKACSYAPKIPEQTGPRSQQNDTHHQTLKPGQTRPPQRRQNQRRPKLNCNDKALPRHEKNRPDELIRPQDQFAGTGTTLGKSWTLGALTTLPRCRASVLPRNSVAAPFSESAGATQQSNLASSGQRCSC
mmetsp:Transcript_50007/g.109325  ORF Transcript_50007/g.109325 Transcript_50007/m.109325 type:complete len:225 (-) Transcript_50007:243-917(-)